MSFNFSTLKLWLSKCFKGQPKHDIARSVSEHKIHLPSLFSIGVFVMVDSKSSQNFIYEVMHVYKLQRALFQLKKNDEEKCKVFLYNFPLISHLLHQIYKRTLSAYASKDFSLFFPLVCDYVRKNIHIFVAINLHKFSVFNYVLRRSISRINAI